MELKKNESHDLEKKTPLFFNIGMVVALSAVIVAFNWKGEIEGMQINEPVDLFDPVYEVPISKILEPEPPKPRAIKSEPKKALSSAIIVATDLPESIKTEEIDFDNDPNNDVDLSGAFTDEPVEIVSDEPMVIVEHMPTFPGGVDAFYQYLSKNMRYPYKAKNRNISGKVFVQFVIDTDGTVTDVKTVKGVGFGCDEAAEEVVRNSPKWSAGKQRGRPVRVRMIIPITFKLN